MKRISDYFLGYCCFYICLFGVEQGSVIHDIPHQMYLGVSVWLIRFTLYAFILQISDSRLGRAEQKIGNMISEYPIMLFRHHSIERTKSCLHMSHGYLQFNGSQGASQSRIGITINKDSIRLL